MIETQGLRIGLTLAPSFSIADDVSRLPHVPSMEIESLEVLAKARCSPLYPMRRCRRERRREQAHI